jgi:hypothetical protein
MDGRAELLTLEGKKLGKYAIHMSEPEPTKLRGAWRFTLHLRNAKDRVSAPVIYGRFFEGRGMWILPWLEVEYHSTVGFGDSELKLPHELELKLFKALSGILPPGGRIMVKYGGHLDTARALAMGVPPPATPLGSILWHAGFRWFKDWYFPEGWMEGDEKLQGNKPMDFEHEKKRVAAVTEKLRSFLRGKYNWDDDLLGKCRDLAGEVLKSIEEMDAPAK